MAQKLIQPINNARLTASYKWGSAYKRDFGGIHYGQDMTGGLTETSDDGAGGWVRGGDYYANMGR